MERIFASIRETSSTLGLGRSTIYRMINGNLAMPCGAASARHLPKRCGTIAR